MDMTMNPIMHTGMTFMVCLTTYVEGRFSDQAGTSALACSSATMSSVLA